MVTAGFDPKWELVKSLTYFEGLNGATVAADVKTNGLFQCYSCAISRMAPEFPSGALHFQDVSASRYAIANFSNSLAFGNNIFEVSFILADWGASGLRRIFRGDNVSAYINPATFTVFFGVNIDGAGWVNVTYTIPDPAAFIGTRHDARFGVTSADQFIELDGVEVARIAHGKTTSANGNQQIRFGQSVSSGDGWIGYIGPFRWTAGDLRPELAGQPMARFPVLGAVDPHREKVVFHSHFEPTETGIPLDEKGNQVVSQGGALTTDARSYGIGSLNIKYGSILVGPNGKFALGEQDFALEFSVPGNYPGEEWVAFSLPSADNAIALRLRGSSNFQALFTINGVEEQVNGPPGRYLSGGRYAVCRTGNMLAIFRDNFRIWSRVVAGVTFTSNGYLQIGGSPHSNSPRIDEFRLTIGNSRHDANLTAATQAVEPFSDFGARSLSGIVDDWDGSPVSCKVRAYHAATGRLVSEGWSDVDGSFVLPVGGVDEHFWTAHRPGKQGLIIDHVIPVVIT